MENLSTLTGKYGEEGDQLLFKILNSGDFLKDADGQNLEARNSKLLAFDIAEKGLRYDLTVPFARYVVMNRNEVIFPFKRYQIQPVWRADRPQKGRYREFYQCDADVVGTGSLICEAEIILMIKEVFQKQGISDFTIKINHRDVLNGIAEAIGKKGNETPLFVAIDKLDKIGEEKVKEELRTKGFPEDSLTQLFDILNVKGSTTNKLAFLASRFETSANGQKGLRDLKEVFNLLNNYGADDSFVEFDVSLARGLTYYTGCIFEVKINNVSIGSVSGGGRYDNLTQAFGDKENLSGVGISFGVDRLYDAMEELDLFPKETLVASKVLICHFDEESMRYGLKTLARLREAGISSEIYPDPAKLKKQLDYGNRKMIPFTIVIGSEEIKSGLLAFKTMESGLQEKLPIGEIIDKLDSDK
jgi:histidyl-tRNA synthetase